MNATWLKIIRNYCNLMRIDEKLIRWSKHVKCRTLSAGRRSQDIAADVPLKFEPKIRLKMHPDSAPIDGRSAADPPPKPGAKVRLLTLASLDARTAAARRARQLIEAIESDLGGADRLTEGARQLVQRAAVLGTFIVPCEAQWLGGGGGRPRGLSRGQRRVLATIGLGARRDPDARGVSRGKTHRWRGHTVMTRALHLVMGRLPHSEASVRPGAAGR
jgi:hypothetical protein